MGGIITLLFSGIGNVRESLYRIRSVAIFRETRNGVRPISGAKNQAKAMAFGGLHSSCVRPGAHSTRRQDSRKDLTPCHRALHFISAGAHVPHSDETPGPTATAGIIVLRSSLTPPRFPVLLRRAGGLAPAVAATLRPLAAIGFLWAQIRVPDYPEGSANLRSCSDIGGVQVAMYPRRGIIAGKSKRRLNREPNSTR